MNDESVTTRLPQNVEGHTLWILFCLPLEQLPVLMLSNILRQGPRKPGEQPITMYRQLGQLSLGFLTTYAPSPRARDLSSANIITRRLTLVIEALLREKQHDLRRGHPCKDCDLMLNKIN